MAPATGAYRCDDSDVRQVRAARSGVIRHEHVAVAPLRSEVLNLPLHSLLHRTQMHREVRRVGHETAVRLSHSET